MEKKTLINKDLMKTEEKIEKKIKEETEKTENLDRIPNQLKKILLRHFMKKENKLLLYNYNKIQKLKNQICEK